MKIRVLFAGDSGDGIQLLGSLFTQSRARARQDFRSLADYPAEIRAPAGSLYGVSAYMIQFGDENILTSGDEADILVAFNPAALKTNLKKLKAGGIIICDKGSFNSRNFRLSGFKNNPLEDGSLKKFRTLCPDISDLCLKALANEDLTKSEMLKSKNIFTLGLLLWLCGKGMRRTQELIGKKFSDNKRVKETNLKALLAGYVFGEVEELALPEVKSKLAPAKLKKGKYRSISGTLGLFYGIYASSKLTKKKLFFSSYPITPASPLLEEMLKLNNDKTNNNIISFQAEDEIAACGMALGAAYGGSIAVVATSGPGLDLMAEMMGLACIVELPLIVIDVMRAGPSTGMPTKSEQSDLLSSIYGRHGETNIPVLAATSPADSFECALEAVKCAITYVSPVILLSDAFNTYAQQPWLLPDLNDKYFSEKNWQSPKINKKDFAPYRRDSKTMARQWVGAGTEGLAHRIGGLEKQDISGQVSYDPKNHQLMSELRAKKIEKIRNNLASIKTDKNLKAGDLLLISFGSVAHVLRETLIDYKDSKFKIDHLSLRWLNPLPLKLEQICRRFKKILVVEQNLGQLAFLIKGNINVELQSLNIMHGYPILKKEVDKEIKKILKIKS